METRIFIGTLIIGIILIQTGTIVDADGGFFFRYENIYQPSQKAVIIYNNEEEKEDLILQVKYEQGAENFAWVVPVPDYPAVNKSDAKLFEELYYLTNPPLRRTPHKFPGGGAGGAGPPGVELLERKRVGIYDAVSYTHLTLPTKRIV